MIGRGALKKADATEIVRVRLGSLKIKAQSAWSEKMTNDHCHMFALFACESFSISQ